MGELKKALFCMGNNKAPRPDGYNPYFFKESWSILSPLSYQVLDDFFLNGKLLSQIYNTLVS